MPKLIDEYNYLLKSEKRINLFKQKTQNLTKLKLNFYQKMLKAEFNKNPEIAENYYNYLIRTCKLSKKIYFRTLQELNEYKKYIESFSLQNNEIEIEQHLNIFPEFKEKYLQFHLTQKQFISKFREFLNKILNPESETNLLLKIEKLIEMEEQHLIAFGEEKDQFFKKLTQQTKIGEEIEYEKTISEQIINEISKLQKELETFGEKMKRISLEIKRVSIKMYREFKEKPLTTMFLPADKAGLVLEKNASLFAATVMTLTAIGKISFLLGMSQITVITETIILVLAEVGEGLQAIPFMKTLPGKFKEYLKNTTQNALNSINEIKNLNISYN